jgi:hypothetical protein
MVARANWVWRLAVAATLTAGLAGCWQNEGIIPSFGPVDNKTVSNNGPTKDSDKIVKLPAKPEDIDCPDVEVVPGGATSRAGGQTNDSVRYQFDISDTARECDPQGNMFGLKVGVAGRLLIGPAGRPGAYSTSMHVQVKRDIDNKILFEKTYRISADTAGADQAPYRLVTDPIPLPLTRARVDLDYTVSVGLGAGGATPVEHRRRRRHDG